MKRYAILLVGLLTACGDSDADGESDGTTSNNQGGEGGTGGSGATGGEPIGGNTNMGGQGGLGGTGGAGGEPIVVEPFLFELNGVAQIPEELFADSVVSQGATQCATRLELDAEFPLTAQDYNYGPKVAVSICTVDLVLDQPITLTSNDGYTFIKYTFFRPGSTHFPKALGTITPLSDGSDGMFVAIADGTIEIDEATVPLHLEINQAVEPIE